MISVSPSMSAVSSGWIIDVVEPLSFLLTLLTHLSHESVILSCRILILIVSLFFVLAGSLVSHSSPEKATAVRQGTLVWFDYPSSLLNKQEVLPDHLGSAENNQTERKACCLISSQGT